MIRCDWCSVKYLAERNVFYKHKDFCSFKCQESYLDVQVFASHGDNPAQLNLPLETGLEVPRISKA